MGGGEGVELGLVFFLSNKFLKDIWVEYKCYSILMSKCSSQRKIFISSSICLRAWCRGPDVYRPIHQKLNLLKNFSGSVTKVMDHVYD